MVVASRDCGDPHLSPSPASFLCREWFQVRGQKEDLTPWSVWLPFSWSMKSAQATHKKKHFCMRNSWGRTMWRALSGQLFLKYSPSPCPFCFLLQRGICCQKLLAEVGRKSAEFFQPSSSYGNEVSTAPWIKRLGGKCTAASLWKDVPLSV